MSHAKVVWTRDPLLWRSSRLCYKNVAFTVLRKRASDIGEFLMQEEKGYAHDPQLMKNIRTFTGLCEVS